MRKIFLVIVANFLISLTSKAQTAEDSIKTVVTNLFIAMKNADGVALNKVFADSAILQTVVNREGKQVVKTENLKEFVNFVSKQMPGEADVQVIFNTIRVEGQLATVWTPYKFYLKGSFSHCGVNSFQLVKIKGEWKIQYLIDTRRRMGCQ